MRTILMHSKNAQAKFVKATGNKVKLDPYIPGDEKDFITKQS